MQSIGLKETHKENMYRFKNCVLDKWKSFIILCLANSGLLFLDEVQLNMSRSAVAVCLTHLREGLLR